MSEAQALFEKLADDFRGLSVHWQQIPKDYADRQDYCRGRSDGLLEAAIALRQVVKNAGGIPTEALTPGSVKALIDACQIALNHINYAGPDALMLDGTPAEEFARGKLTAAIAPFEGAQEVKPNAESPA